MGKTLEIPARTTELFPPDTVCQIESVGFDWIFGSTLTDGPWASTLEAIAMYAHKEQLRQGIAVEPAKWFGYEGIQAGGVFVGHDDKRTVVQATSGAAMGIAQEIRKHCPEIKVARTDYQVTAHIPKSGDRFVRNCFHHWEDRGHRSRQNKRMSGDLKWSAKRGETLYLGAFGSDMFSLIYYKSFEQRGLMPPDRQRFENRRNGKYSRHLWSDYCNCTNDSEFVKSVVMKTFDSQGFPLEFLGDCPEINLKIGRHVQDIDKWCEWFEKSVKPGALRRCDLGHRDRIAGLVRDLLKEVENEGPQTQPGYPIDD